MCYGYGCGEIHSRLVRTVHSDRLIRRDKGVSAIARRHGIAPVRQSAETVIPSGVRRSGSRCGTNQGNGRATSAGRWCDRPGNAEGVRLRVGREIDSRDVGAIDRCVLAGWAIRVTRRLGVTTYAPFANPVKE